MPRGYMVVFCGMDCSGKSSVIDELYAKRFFSENEKLMYHPPDEWRRRKDILAAYLDGEGEKIKDEDEIIFTRNLRLKIQDDIVDGIRKGKNYVFHRYIFSLYTYYAGSRTVDMKWIRNQMENLVKPDEVIYLRISPEEFRERSKLKPIISFQQIPGFVERMIDCYDNLAQEYDWKIVDTSQYSLEETVDICAKIINKIDTSVPLRLFGGGTVV